MSFSAPAAEKLDWQLCSDYGYVGLPELRLSRLVYCLRIGVRTLLLHVISRDLLLVPVACERSFAQEIVRLQVTDFSALKLVIRSGRHAFGPLLLHLLQIQPVICKLQLELDQGKLKDGLRLCPQNCSCRQPTNWKNENISLPDLEEVTVCYGYKIGDEEVDFLKLLLRCAPMLKRLKVGVPGVMFIAVVVREFCNHD
ncbi:unnamed protein product [Urochloa humidicola]